MIKLYQFPAFWGLPNVSPFCMKLEMYLRLANIPYEIVVTPRPSQGPKGKLPYIEDKGTIIGDSGLIIDYLKANYGDPLDAHLTPEQKGIALAIQRLLEEHFFWVVVYNRWIDPAGWGICKPVFFRKMPALLKWFVPSLIHKYMIKKLRTQGLGSHTHDEIYAMGKADIAAISALFGDKPFMLGDQVSSIDATVYASIATVLIPPLESPLKASAKSFSNLITYCERMQQLTTEAL
jgi:glutathione S-transferase